MAQKFLRLVFDHFQNLRFFHESFLAKTERPFDKHFHNRTNNIFANRSKLIQLIRKPFRGSIRDNISKKFNYRGCPKHLSKIENFLKNRNFCQKSKFMSKIEIFVKNRNFSEKSKLF